MCKITCQDEEAYQVAAVVEAYQDEACMAYQGAYLEVACLVVAYPWAAASPLAYQVAYPLAFQEDHVVAFLVAYPLEDAFLVAFPCQEEEAYAVEPLHQELEHQHLSLVHQDLMVLSQQLELHLDLQSDQHQDLLEQA